MLMRVIIMRYIASNIGYYIEKLNNIFIYIVTTSKFQTKWQYDYYDTQYKRLRRTFVLCVWETITFSNTSCSTGWFIVHSHASYFHILLCVQSLAVI